MWIRFTCYTIFNVKVHQKKCQSPSSITPNTNIINLHDISTIHVPKSFTLYEVKSPFLDVTWANTPFCNLYVNSFQGQNYYFVIYEKIYNLTIKTSYILLKTNLEVLTIKMTYGMFKSNHWINYSQVKIQLLYTIPMIETRNMWLQLINCD